MILPRLRGHIRSIAKRHATWIELVNDYSLGADLDKKSPRLNISNALGMLFMVTVPREGFHRGQFLWVSDRDIQRAISELPLSPRVKLLTLTFEDVNAIFLRATDGLIDLQLEP